MEYKSPYYALDAENKPHRVPCKTNEEYASWSQKYSEKQRVNLTIVTEAPEVKVSTVFLGMDHNYSNTGDPILFETMIFGGPHNDWQDRCCTYDQAILMHKRAVSVAKGEVPPEEEELVENVVVETDVEETEIYGIWGDQLEAIRSVASRLFTENRMNGDEMRDAAQKLSAIFDNVVRFGQSRLK